MMRLTILFLAGMWGGIAAERWFVAYGMNGAGPWFATVVFVACFVTYCVLTQRETG